MAVDYKSNPAVYNKEVRIFKEVIVADAFGSPQSVWHPIKKVKASIEPMAGREYMTAAQAQAEGSVRIVIRYLKGVTDRSRVLYKGVEGDIWYELKSPPVNPLESNRYLELVCTRLATSPEMFEDSAIVEEEPDTETSEEGLLP